ncbi:hypothetical protein Tco_0482305 [Tanacetum coccineum]
MDVDLHYGSTISPYLLSLILDELSQGITREHSLVLDIRGWNANDQNEEAEICIGDHILQTKESFIYLGFVIHKSGRIKVGNSTVYVVRVRVLAINKGLSKQDGSRKNEDAKRISTPVRRVGCITIDGLMRRGRPKLRQEDKLKIDLKKLLLSEDMTSNRIS